MSSCPLTCYTGYAEVTFFSFFVQPLCLLLLEVILAIKVDLSNTDVCWIRIIMNSKNA